MLSFRDQVSNYNKDDSSFWFVVGGVILMAIVALIFIGAITVPGFSK